MKNVNIVKETKFKFLRKNVAQWFKIKPNVLILLKEISKHNLVYKKFIFYYLIF